MRGSPSLSATPGNSPFGATASATVPVVGAPPPGESLRMARKGRRLDRLRLDDLGDFGPGASNRLRPKSPYRGLRPELPFGRGRFRVRPFLSSTASVRRREPPLLVVIRIELPQPAGVPAFPSPPSPSSARASSRVLIPAETRMLQRLGLLQRVDRVVADPDEFEIRLAHADLDHPVERALDPGLQRHEAFLRRLQAHGLAGRAVDLRDEGRGGDGEGVADDAREPLVVLVLRAAAVAPRSA